MLMSMAFSSFNDQLFCFGGYQDGAGDKCDFLMLSDTSMQSFQSHFCIYFFGGDAFDCVLVLIGSQMYFVSFRAGFLCLVFVLLLLFQSSHSTETPGRFCKLTVTGDLPSVRERTTSSVIGSSIYLFGGYNRSKESYYNDLFVFNCGTNLFFFCHSFR
jgi:hypothetical protein